MDEKEICRLIFTDLFNGNYDSKNSMKLLEKHLGTKNLEETKKILKNEIDDDNFSERLLKIFNQRTINHQFYETFMDFMCDYA